MMRSILILYTALLTIIYPAHGTTTTASHSIAGLHLDWRDPKILPGENFYTYANGEWQKQNPIPPEYPSWSSFNVLQEKVQKIIHQLMINAANDQQAKPGSIERKVGDFYFSGMDEKTINQQGVKPLQPVFARIAAIKNKRDLQQTIPYLQKIGVDVLFDFSSMQDFKDSTRMIGILSQGGLGLPDRDYYLKQDKKFRAIRDAYLHHIAAMFVLLGDEPGKAATKATTVLNIETALAKASMSKIAQRDPNAIYHIMDRKQLNKITPDFSWAQYFTAMGRPDIKHVNLAMPDFFKTMNEQLRTVPITAWQTYLRWRLIDAFAPYLSKPFVDQNFRMVSTLTGTRKLLPRWKRVVATENAALGFAVGKLYVERYFPPSSRQAALDILHDVRRALQRDLRQLAWMTPQTRLAALKKLDLMEERIGYPDKWRDYSSLHIDRGPYVLNIIRANEFLVRRDLDKINKPVDRSEWAMPPQTINAYYDPSMNNLNIPAGILQPPFFDPKAPAAVNYGAIGFVMGHEMTHAFDDQGAQFDGHGNLKNWWTATDLKKFQAATSCIAEQFSRYKIDGLAVQGKLVMGEATADLGGLTLAFHALHHSDHYRKARTIDGLSPDQQFFLGAAHVWAANIRPEQARYLITVDPHPPARYRVNGSFANMPQFQKAFALPEQSPMVNNPRCVIW
ncbi:M13 family metallopeptidase [Legionella spiritensis]|uniref:Metallopeptidase PepO, peptidase, M13 family transporter n=1 Tax=Legionella spiritensis TaxID=452 RepID=A0A0W0YZ44_LEGSP|nr:M13 family metallopeptidase [Legionella spiritensis]KTD61782.1 metallopeptidase PepO, peptidase, M13 family transporter [Legionella spiritensis]SNV38467.1 metallopeptidase PepO [Legionella spiritensis]